MSSSHLEYGVEEQAAQWIDHDKGRSIAAIQSNYIPWIGYFDIINAVDEFVFIDDVQYTRRDWRNRNRIRSLGGGSQWLTIPVLVKGRYTQRIDETVVSDGSWAQRHWQTLQQAYHAAPYFRHYEDRVREAYHVAESLNKLSDINRHFIELCCSLLEIDTPIRWSTEFTTESERNARLIGLCTALDARQYLSGPSAKEYLDADAFATVGTEIRYADYSAYQRYDQVHEGFDPAVTVLDPIFNLGNGAQSLLLTRRGKHG